MSQDKFIVKDGASLYYLRAEGMGGFLNPPGHAEHSLCIVEKRGGHQVGSMSLSCASTCDYVPAQVRSVAKAKLSKSYQITPEWVKQVYAYFRHCYSKDGTNRSASDCTVYGKFFNNADKEKDENPEHHLGYLFVKQFDPNHTPRVDLF